MIGELEDTRDDRKGVKKNMGTKAVELEGLGVVARILGQKVAWTALGRKRYNDEQREEAADYAKSS